MSIEIALAVRNMLRDGLENFHDGNDRLRKASCRVMPDDRPAPNCGNEFISVYCSAWNPIDAQELYGLHEEVTITVAVTHKTGVVPFDSRGEAAYLADEDFYVRQSVSLESRIREINRLIHPDYTGQVSAFAAVLVDKQQPYDKLCWIGADSQPRIVGPDHFHASGDAETGLLLRTYFKGAKRLHFMGTLDWTEE